MAVKRSVWVLMMAVFFLSASTPAGAGQGVLTTKERAWLAEHGPFRLAPAPNFLPTDGFKDGRYWGITADTVTLIQKKLGIKFIKIVRLENWAEVIKNFKAGRSDMISAIQSTPDRRRYMLFTKTYVELPIGIIVAKKVAGSVTLDRINKTKGQLAVPAGYATQTWVAKNYPGIRLVAVPDILTGLREVSFGRVYAFLGNLATASYWIDRQGLVNLRVAGLVDYTWRLSFACQKKYPLLRRILDKGLALITPAERRAIYRKYVHLEPPGGSLFQTKEFRLIVFICLGGLLLAVAWILSLRKVVDQRTRALRESEERFRTLLEESFDGMFVVKGTDIVYANRRCQEMLGYGEGELEGMRHWLVYHPDYQDLTRERAEARRRGEEVPGRYEVKFLRKDGSSFDGDISAGIIMLDGEPAVQGWVRDLTERKMAEEALQQSEEKYRQVTDHSLTGVYIHRGGRFIYVNRRLAEILGYPEAEIVGRSFWELVHPDDREIVKTRGMARSRGEKVGSNHYEFRAVRSDGRIRWLEVMASTIQLGDATANMGNVVDVTERRMAEEALRESEQQYRLLADNVTDVICVMDLDRLVFTYTSPSIERQWGYTPEEALSLSLAKILTPPSFEVATQVLAEELEEEKTGNADPNRCRILESELYRKDRSTTWIEVSASFLRDETGKAISILGVTRDITERKRAEEALKESRERYRLILEASPDPVVLYDMEGNVIYFNPAFTRVFGWTLDELLGQRIDFVPDEARPETNTMIEMAKRGENFSGIETRRYTKKGDIVDVSVSGAMWPEQSGVPAGSVVNLRDITEQKKLEAQLRQATKMEAVGTLAGGVAHDFNNVLQAIAGYVQLLLLRKNADDPDHEYLTGIDQSVKRASGLIKQLLNISRKVEANLQPVDLNQEVRHVSGLLERTLPKMIEIETQLSDDLYPVNADPIQLEQILLNLGANARDAMPDGGRLVIETKSTTLDEIHTRSHPELSPGNYVLLRVSDTGCGMDKDTVEHIFEPFFTTKGQGVGTGLGLATAYGIVKSHGGRITCYSEPGHGSVFTVYLPALTADGAYRAAPTEDEAEAEVRGGHEAILLVDDEKAILDTGEEMLKQYGYAVLKAASGEEALDIDKRQGDRIDVVILDLNMPGIGGRKCLKVLRSVDPEAKVIIASGYTSRSLAVEAEELEAAGFIDKPYTIAGLLKRVRDVLDNGPGRRV